MHAPIIPSLAAERAEVAALPLNERLARQCELKAYLLRDKALEQNTSTAQWAMEADAEAWEQQAARYRRIRTSHVYPPIPTRNHDWCAYYDGREESGPDGWGSTEEAAINDLISNYEVAL